MAPATANTAIPRVFSRGVVNISERSGPPKRFSQFASVKPSPMPVGSSTEPRWIENESTRIMIIGARVEIVSTMPRMNRVRFHGFEK